VTEAFLDTDILSFYLKGDQKVVERISAYLGQYDQLNFSIITYYEIIAGLKCKNASNQIVEFENFTKNNNLIYFSESTARLAGDIYTSLRVKGVTIGTSDILIAAIAIENDLSLVTNNEKHFAPILNLKIENWKK
jgi:tRNA(fMet)-specific endonuclease VapC